ncbi:transport protein particle component [Cylindrobasidium torrendii FP15055 ss-10]|uniref:Transport protein particle component n=1 Tax=Cylindrobasidium torrendii FP15055 ss-10 TaxID=1314674 RepID=A0A0D7BQW2_9AGAR|nr:transport protein particle component [Cylindrobasidium torrendii FP15055 ss-10]
MTSRASTSSAPSTTKVAASLVSPALASLAEPSSRSVDGAMMDFFLIELVNSIVASSAVATKRAKEIEQEMVENGLLPPPAPPPPPMKEPNPRDSTTSLGGRKIAQPEDELEEAARTRLESIGAHVGASFTERLCLDKAAFGDTLEAVKFICKDVWSACWDKQVDNLRTNHRGIYVLQDNAFKPILRLSSWKGRSDATTRARLYVALSAGIIRGALSRLGYNATVTTEITSLPQCTFQVKLPSTKHK